RSGSRGQRAWDAADQFVCLVSTCPTSGPCTHGNDANLHQSQLAPGNNAVSSYGISTCLQVLMRLARLGTNKTEKNGEKTMPVRMLVVLTAFVVAAMVATTAHAQKKYDPGTSDTEI